MLGAGCVGGDERQVDFGLIERRELDFGALRRFAQSLQRHAVLLEVDALLAPEFVHNPINDALVEVVAAQVSIAVGSHYFEHAVADLQHGYVECAAAEVIDGDGFVGLLV